MNSDELKSGFLDAGGRSIYYSELGDGPPVIFLHGGGPGAFGLSNFSRNIDAFAAHFRTVVIDFPCYGKSQKLEINEPLWGFYGRLVADVIDALGLQRAHLIGNSLGGAAALKCAMNNPEKVDKLVVMGCAGGFTPLNPSPTEGIRALLDFYQSPGPTLEKLRRFSECLVFDSRYVTPELLEERFAAASDPETAKYMPIQLRNGKPPRMEELWREPLNDITHETLMIWGRDDRVNTLEQGMTLFRQLPNAKLMVYPQCGHWAQWEQADTFNEDVLNFLMHRATSFEEQGLL